MGWGSLRDEDGKVFTTIITKQLMVIDQGVDSCLHKEIPDDSLRVQKVVAPYLPQF
jgi:hypothetical protein